MPRWQDPARRRRRRCRTRREIPSSATAGTRQQAFATGTNVYCTFEISWYESEDKMLVT